MRLQPGNEIGEALSRAARRGEALERPQLRQLKPRFADGYPPSTRSGASALAAIAMAVLTMAALVALPARLESAATVSCTPSTAHDALVELSSRAQPSLHSRSIATARCLT